MRRLPDRGGVYALSEDVFTTCGVKVYRAFVAIEAHDGLAAVVRNLLQNEELIRERLPFLHQLLAEKLIACLGA